MKSGYNVFWSENALIDLKNIIEYLSENWTDKEIKNFAIKLEKRVSIIKQNPQLFPKTAKRKGIRRSVLTKQTVLYYISDNESITFLALFDSRKDPKKFKLK